MKNYLIFLLDDETVFLKAFEHSLRKYLETLPLSFSIRAFTTLSELKKEAVLAEPDLIISDIDLPDESQTGISFLHDLKSSGCHAEIIFLTNYLHFATDIFELHPIYFILKSEFEQRLPSAISLFLKKVESQPTFLSLRIGHDTEIFPTDSVLYCEHVWRKTIVHCTNKTVTVTTPLPEIAKQLPADTFSFSHQSVLVNLQFVKSFGASSLIMTDGSELPISRARSEEFRRAMAAYLAE